MKKLYLFFAVLCALFGSQTANATIYFSAGQWANDGVKMQAYFWNSSNNSAWVNIATTNSDGYYVIEVPSDSWSNLLFTRGSEYLSAWDSSKIYNQTVDLTFTDGALYKFTGWDDNKKDNDGQSKGNVSIDSSYTPPKPTPSTGYPTVELWNKSTGKVASYTGSGSSWSLASTAVNIATNSDNARYRIRVYLNSSYYTEYTTSSGVDNENYWIGTSSITAAEAGDNGYFVFNNDFSTGYVIGTLTLNTSTYDVSTFQFSASSSGSVTPDDPDTPSVDLSKVNMPLKEADFADGKAHYFVVGTRMSEWRLQPEWELQPQNDGTYTLENRLVYTGKMGIAKVDNYEDYCYQRYTFYSQNIYQKSGETYNVTLSQQTNNKQVNGGYTQFTAIRYNNSGTHGQFETGKTFRFEYTGDLNETGILQSTPTLVGKMTLTLSDGTPTTFVMSSITTEASEIAKYRTFSLVGSKIGYVDASWATATPLYLQDGYTSHMAGESWQEGWIQYDNYGKPYVDGYGNTIYQTVFQREWLASHPTLFRASDGFEYNSLNMVLNYDASQTHGNTIPDTGETAYWFNGSQNSGSRTAANGWQCFVLENMWLEGNFKVWTGWGGANKYHDGSGTNQIYARWNYDNGGHEGKDIPWTITASENTFYMTKRNIDGADYSLGDSRIFVRYVKLWWDPSGGFDNSNIQLITETGGPQIECKRSGKHELTYTYSVPDIDGQLENYNVKSYRIDRYHIGSDGVLVLDVEGVESGSYEESEAKKATTISGTDVVDTNNAEGGTYYYYIKIEYYANSVAGLDEDFTRDAESNRVFIYYDTVPENVSVRQLAYDEPEATTEALTTATEKYWSFDLAVNASAPSSLIGQTCDKDGETVDVLSLVKYYVVAAPKLSGGDVALYTSASDNAVAITSENTDLASQIFDFDFDNYTYFGLEPDASNNYAMPELKLSHVIPGNYTFTISMISVDSDETQWEEFNVSSATASVNMVKPGVEYTASEFKIEKCSPAETAEFMYSSTYEVLGNDRMNMTYTNSNKISTTNGKFAPLMVTNGVLSNWNVKYTVETKMVKPEASGPWSYTYTLEGINGKALNDDAGVTADFTYLPMDYTKETAFADCTIDVIKDVKKRIAKASTITTSTSVAYSRITGSTAYISSDAVTGSIEIDPSKDAFVNGSALKEYEVTAEKYIYQVQDSYNYEDEEYGSKYGTVTYFTNAFASFQWTPGTTLHNAAGFHSVSSHTGCSVDELKNGYTVIDDDGLGYKRVQFPNAGGEVLRDNGNTADYYITYDDDANIAEAVATVGKLPIKVWHVGDGQSTPASTLTTAITADYPVLINPTLTATLTALDETEIATASVEDGVFTTGTIEKAMISFSYPKLYTKDLSGTTTDITNVAVDGAGDFRIYPNPAVDVVNVASSAALGRVEIYSVDGRLVKVVEVDDTHAAIEVSDLVKGSYIIRAAGATQRLVKR